MEQEGEKKNEEKPGKIARDYQVINDIGQYCRISTTLNIQCKKLKTNAAPCQLNQFQVDLLEKAKKENSIIFLGTGSGKTFIATMLVKHYMDEMLM